MAFSHSKYSEDYLGDDSDDDQNENEPEDEEERQIQEKLRHVRLASRG